MMTLTSVGRIRRVLGWALLLLPSLLLMSCAMGPDYVRPHIETAEKFRMAETEGQSIANLPWWELLRDEELQRLIRQALGGKQGSQAGGRQRGRAPGSPDNNAL